MTLTQQETENFDCLEVLPKRRTANIALENATRGNAKRLRLSEDRSKKVENFRLYLSEAQSVNGLPVEINPKPFIGEVGSGNLVVQPKSGTGCHQINASLADVGRQVGVPDSEPFSKAADEFIDIGVVPKRAMEEEAVSLRRLDGQEKFSEAVIE